MSQLLARISLPIFALFLGACSLQQPPADLVVLTSPQPQRAAAAQPSPLAPKVWVGEVIVPEYLDTYDVLIRTSPHQLRPDPDAQWAEKLPSALTRLMREEVTSAGYLLVDPADYEILLDVDRFEAVSDGAVALSARWRILHLGDDETVVAQGDVDLREPIAEGPRGYLPAMEAAARSLSARLLDDLAQGIAKQPVRSGTGVY